MAEQYLIDGQIMLRPDEDGEFDELFLIDGDKYLAHAEMMSDRSLWIGFYPRGGKRRVCMWIGIKRGKLYVHAAED